MLTLATIAVFALAAGVGFTLGLVIERAGAVLERLDEAREEDT